jgi:hypothetical protein
LPTKLEKLLEVLGDGAWHPLEEVAKALKMPKERFQQVVNFLADADIIQRNSVTSKVKLNQNWKTLMIGQGNESLENSEKSIKGKVLGTIIVPPQKSVVIQYTQITNLTDKSLELEICVDKKIEEITISVV